MSPIKILDALVAARKRGHAVLLERAKGYPEPDRDFQLDRDFQRATQDLQAAADSLRVALCEPVPDAWRHWGEIADLVDGQQSSLSPALIAAAMAKKHRGLIAEMTARRRKLAGTVPARKIGRHGHTEKVRAHVLRLRKQGKSDKDILESLKSLKEKFKGQIPTTLGAVRALIHRLIRPQR